MNLRHYSKAAEITVESRQQDNTWHHKPRGFWVSDEDDYGWSQWTEENEYGIGANAFEVSLAPDANVLLLGTVDAVRDFDRQFSVGSNRYRVDWARVAEQWQGIIITPYQWKLRLSDVDWYYTWDCASGCIWDAAAIRSVERIAVEAVTA